MKCCFTLCPQEAHVLFFDEDGKWPLCKGHEEEGEVDLRNQFEDKGYSLQVIQGPELLVWEVMES